MSRLVFVALGVAGVIAACSSSSDGDAQPNYAGSCAILASQCHPYDGKSQLGTECHNLGHDGDDAKCGPRLAACQAECPETDAALPFTIVDGAVVHPTSDATGDATVPDAGPDPCASYCACFQEACSAKHTELYATGSCVETCRASFSADNRTCYAAACEKAKGLAIENRKHECDHASGTIECH